MIITVMLIIMIKLIQSLITTYSYSNQTTWNSMWELIIWTLSYWGFKTDIYSLIWKHMHNAPNPYGQRMF